jgi:uncharacterized repeat protein (TIGR03803 family)
MQCETFSTGVRVAVAVFIATLLVPGARVAAQEKVLHNFNLDGSGGASPLYGALITDEAGNLYGTTSEGGPPNRTGTVFELHPPLAGKKSWREAVLWSFSDIDSGKGGIEPFAGLVFDSSHINLYGTTYIGGTYNGGTIFELSPKKGGGWTHTVLHDFNDDNGDGYDPYAGLVIDAKGNLYGTTYRGGASGLGTVFELKPPAAGKTDWTEHILHSFQGNPTDGANPEAGLSFDGNGNLYGTTVYGDTNGLYNAGTVFELSPVAGGGWKYTGVIWSFSNNGVDGSEPGYGSLVLDKSGNLYGTTSGGGTNFLGTVFELSPKTGGGWSETILWDFGSGEDGAFPYAGVIFDTSGNLYGTTFQGGEYDDGSVFKLTPNLTESLLHSFNNNGVDGFEPYAGLLLNHGVLYGTTPGGGKDGFGTVFRVKP